MSSLGVQMNLKKIIKKSEKSILKIARQKYECCNVFSFGATDIDPKHLAIWVTTDSDSQRDTLIDDAGFQKAARDILRKNGYPEESIPLVVITFESEETVKRDYEGNWWYAVK